MSRFGIYIKRASKGFKIIHPTFERNYVSIEIKLDKMKLYLSFAFALVFLKDAEAKSQTFLEQHCTMHPLNDDDNIILEGETVELECQFDQPVSNI